MTARRQPEGPPPPPVVQRLRVRYTKTGRLRFTSHRDFARAFERALRRAGVPMAYSAGFSPHPKISYAGAAPTGVASLAEYLEIGLAREVEPDRVREALDAALPAGLDIVAVVALAGERTALADRLEASLWRVELPGVTPEALTDAAERLLPLPAAEVRRATKDGHRIIDARSAIVALTCEDAGTAEPGPSVAETGEPGRYATMHMVVRHTTPAVRPDDVVAALREHAGLPTPESPRVTRLAQGQLPAGSTEGMSARAIELSDPLVADIAAARG